MKCHFCSKDCKPVPDMDYFKYLKEECKEHPYLVRAFSRKDDPSTIHYTFYPMYGNRKYKVLVVIDDGKVSCTISCGIVYNDLGSSAINKDIITFDFDPGITPENVLRKLPTILTFL